MPLIKNGEAVEDHFVTIEDDAPLFGGGLGLDSLDALQAAGTVDVIITDYAMPGMTGIQFAERVKAQWPSLPVILASGYAELPEDSGADIIRLPKPYGRADLIRAINLATQLQAAQESTAPH